ncbi:galactose metabolism-related protein [Marasmius crinis-equi]|uniref:Galactose metabolism-related protein n=1 Tax=Marasmius crinis-equi TaxID=585013 RepID=A0ABR3FIZ6_9AGAR
MSDMVEKHLCRHSEYLFSWAWPRKLHGHTSTLPTPTQDLSFTVDRIPEPVNYVAVGLLASPTGDENTVNVIPRDDDWEPASPTQRIFDETDRNDSSWTSIVSSVFSSTAETASSAWDSIDEDEDDKEIYDNCSSQPTSPIPRSGLTPPVPAIPRYEPEWTDEIPLEIVEAAFEEEFYLTRAQSQETEAQKLSKPPRRSPTPLPEVPFPPELPRYLDRPILSRTFARKTIGKGCSNGTVSPSSPSEGGSRGGRDVRSYSSVERTSSLEARAASVIASPTLHEGVDVGDKEPSLPVPAHSVLGHLCTTAIKHGVVGMASTARYRAKFVTTIYYKPLS